MARPRKRENNDLPQNLLCRWRKRTSGQIVEYFYYVMADGKEKSLGINKYEAVLEAAQLNFEFGWLCKFFGDPPIPLERIEPKHIKQYLQWRKDTPAVANIEMGLFNTIWNSARKFRFEISGRLKEIREKAMRAYPELADEITT